ncbi:MAG TPA: DEAD/DEAH box helicase family protein, partial [Deferrisomatales bacterium]|nr:DEAD/DEAH box helicase family protein [Deferrisomatales bacterium]
PDDSCRFLVMDFDGRGWEADLQSFREACAREDVPAIFERSRSGEGAHAWVFFAEAIPARLARGLGSHLLTVAMDQRPEMGLDSYDRLFPSQDTLPQGGFGNLIALPLQWVPRQSGNSLFVDEALQPYPDPWAHLSEIRRMERRKVEGAVATAEARGGVLGVRVAPEEEGVATPWLLPLSGPKLDAVVPGDWPSRVSIVLSDLVYVDRKELPPAAVNRLLRLAAFQNPEFYKAQALRLPTYDKPRVIGCGELFPDHVGLPRGVLGDVEGFLTGHGIAIDFDDKRFEGKRIKVKFRGKLKRDQLAAAKALLDFDIGILSAGTAFGKTVVGAHLIAKRHVNTLVLVHRQQLIDQWRERLAVFLELDGQGVGPLIGKIGGGTRRPTGIVDVATIQSLYRRGVVDDTIAEYGQVIVDECHHLSAVSFEQVLRKAKGRYVLGLTATPTRRDGHHPIITMQCGPIRFRTDPKKLAAARPFHHVVIPRRLSAVQAGVSGPIQEVLARVASVVARNGEIAADVTQAVGEGRACLVLTGRLDHLDSLAGLLADKVPQLLSLRGRMGKKEQKAVFERLLAIPPGEGFAVLATGRFIGEGFDEARLDTLFLAAPIAWRGTLQQYAGRLHRLHDGKTEVRVFDYVDDGVPVLESMFRKRLRGYKAMGYEVRQDTSSLGQEQDRGQPA